MGSSSSDALKMAAVLLLALFAGQLLIAEPAAAACPPSGPEDESVCSNCLSLCGKNCLLNLKSPKLAFGCTAGCATFCGTSAGTCFGLCGTNCLAKTPDKGEVGCTEGCLVACPNTKF